MNECMVVCVGLLITTMYMLIDLVSEKHMGNSCNNPSVVEAPVDKVSGQPLIVNGLPRYLFIHIRRSKTDQDGQGM